MGLSNYNRAMAYIEKHKLLGIESKLKLELVEDDGVNLYKIKSVDNDGSITLQSFITSIKSGVFSGLDYSKIVIECDISDISGLFNGICSSKLKVVFKGVKNVKDISELFLNSKELKIVEIVG